MKNKLLSFLLVIMMVISNVSIPIKAQGNLNPTLQVNSVSAVPGETVDVLVTIKDNPGMISSNLKISWDQGLELISAENGEAFSTLSLVTPDPLVSGKSWETS